jgi:hypothetical protein
VLSAAFAIAGDSPRDTGYGLRIDSTIFCYGTFTQPTAPYLYDSLVDVIACHSTTDSQYYSYKSNFVQNVGRAFLLDTVYMPFHRANTSTYAHLGALKYLTNKATTHIVYTTGISKACSLSTRFRHDNDIYADSFWVKNSWITGDTARVYLDYKTLAGAWTIGDSLQMVAGQKSYLTKMSLNPSTQYVIRFRTIGLSAGTTHILDTTYLDTIKTLRRRWF